MPSRRRQARKLLTAATAVVALGVATTTTEPAQAAQSTSAPHTEPHADGIIAVLIGAHAPPPPGATKGSFIDASTVYGSAD